MATLLAITVLLPLLGSLVLILAPRLDRSAARSIALGCTLATLAFSLILLVSFRTGVLAPQFAFGPQEGPYGLRWLSRPDIRFALGLDGLTLWLFLLTALLMITAVLSSWEAISERAPLYYAFLLALETGLLGTLRQSRRGALLHLLRVHADSALLPDRTVGRSAAAAGIDHVLSLHAGGQPA